MTETEKIRCDSMADMMQELGITATREQIEQLTKDFVEGLEIEREIYNTQFRNSKPPECEQCKILKRKISELQNDEESYRKWIAKATAQHNHVHADEVFVTVDRTGNINLERK